MKFVLALFALLSFLAASKTESLSGDNNGIEVFVDEESHLSSQPSPQNYEAVQSGEEPASNSITKVTPENSLKSVTSLSQKLVLYLLACASGVRFLGDSFLFKDRNGPCCGTVGDDLVFYHALFLTLLEFFIVAIGPQWGSKAQALSAGLVLPQTMVMGAMIVGLLNFANTELFVIFLNSAPYLFSLTPHLLFLAFIVSEVTHRFFAS